MVGPTGDCPDWTIRKMSSAKPPRRSRETVGERRTERSLSWSAVRGVLASWKPPEVALRVALLLRDRQWFPDTKGWAHPEVRIFSFPGEVEPCVRPER